MGLWYSYPMAVYPVYGPYDYNYYGPRHVYVYEKQPSMEWVNTANNHAKIGNVMALTQTIVPHMSTKDLLAYEKFLDNQENGSEMVKVKGWINDTKLRRNDRERLMASDGHRM